MENWVFPLKNIPIHVTACQNNNLKVHFHKISLIGNISVDSFGPVQPLSQNSRRSFLL